MQRLVHSAYIYRMKSPYTVEQLSTAATDIVRENHLSSCYIRPLMIRGYGDVNVNPLPCPIETYMACWEWGAYLGAEALEQGVDVCVSSWARLAPNTLPSMAKAGANYMNSQLIRMEAIANGYAEGIALDANGYVSEGSGENIFVVRDGAIYTPPLASSVLPGITRSTIMTLCEDLGIPVREEMIPREMLYIADEVFLHRHRRRNHAAALGGPHHHRRRPPRPRSPSACKRNSSPFSPAPSPTGTTGSRPLPPRWPRRAES